MTFEEIKEKGVITKKQLSYLCWKKRGKVNSDGCLVCEEIKWYFKDYFICEYDSYNAIEMLKEEFNIEVVESISEQDKQELLYITAFLPFKFSEVYGEDCEDIDSNAFNLCYDKNDNRYIRPEYNLDYINKHYPELDYKKLFNYIVKNYINDDHYLLALRKYITSIHDMFKNYEYMHLSSYLFKSTTLNNIVYELYDYLFDLEILNDYLNDIKDGEFTL